MATRILWRCGNCFRWKHTWVDNRIFPGSFHSAQLSFKESFRNKYSVHLPSIQHSNAYNFKISPNVFYRGLRVGTFNPAVKDAQKEKKFEPPQDESSSNEGVKLKKENPYTIPNALCVLRIGMTPFIAHTIVHGQFGLAIGLLAVAGVTDLLDGWIARVVPGQSTVMGSFLDPLADKILVGTLFLSLTYMDLIPVPLTALIVGRDAILMAFGFYIRYQSLDPPKTLTRYFDVTHPTAQLAPLFISKVNTGLQMALIGATLTATVVSSIDLHPYLQILWYSTAATTVVSAIWYCFTTDSTVKLLREKTFKIKVGTRKKV